MYAGYKPVAQVVSVLFFVMSELAAIEPMYQYSLAWFVSLFEDTIVKADKARELSKRIENLVSHFQYSLYVQVGGPGQQPYNRNKGADTSTL